MGRRKRYNQLKADYREEIAGDWCVYCGDRAETQDHFPPLSVTHKGWLLPCCKWCNSFLGNRWPFSLEMRVAEVKKRLERKLRRMHGDWTNSEIEEELEGTLKGFMKQWQTEKRILRGRVVWCAKTYLQSIAPHTDFAAKHVVQNSTTDE